VFPFRNFPLHVDMVRATVFVIASNLRGHAQSTKIEGKHAMR